MDGVLLIDKPSGPTSHDAVARIRRSTGERRVGHTGTLDPRATGLLALVLGCATRLASVLSSDDKTYDATIRLGYSTDTDDADGVKLEEPGRPLPSDAELAAALEHFRGVFEQRPPNHSAKRVGGTKAYDLARRAEPVVLKPVMVTVHCLETLGRTRDLVQLRLTTASGFYVRALARDLGATLGCGAHLAELRRTHCGHFSVVDALSLDEAERMGAAASSYVLAPAAALPHLDAVSVTEAGLKRATHGNPLGPEHLEGRRVPLARALRPVRILGADGHLVALGHVRGGALHPTVVLG